MVLVLIRKGQPHFDWSGGAPGKQREQRTKKWLLSLIGKCQHVIARMLSYKNPHLSLPSLLLFFSPHTFS